jgi:microcystin-dependent protein
MKRIDGPGATPDNRFTEGNPAANIPATEITADYMNIYQEELCNVVEKNGISLNGNSNTQLYEAMKAMLVSNTSVGRYFQDYDGGGTTFTLPITPSSAYALTVWVNGVTKIPTKDFTISQNVLTITAGTPAGTKNVNVLIEGAANEIISQDKAGDLKAFYGTTARDGWLLCAGQEVSRSTYPALFAAIGTSAGAGDGTATFNVPDFRGRVLVGLDNLGGTAAGRIAGLNSLGGTGGAANVTPTGSVAQTTLTIDQIPNHKHDYVYGPSNGQLVAGGAGGGADGVFRAGGTNPGTTSVGGGLGHGHGLTMNAHTILQPYAGVGVMIKT